MVWCSGDGGTEGSKGVEGQRQRAGVDHTSCVVKSGGGREASMYYVYLAAWQHFGLRGLEILGLRVWHYSSCISFRKELRLDPRVGRRRVFTRGWWKNPRPKNAFLGRVGKHHNTGRFVC